MRASRHSEPGMWFHLTFTTLNRRHLLNRPDVWSLIVSELLLQASLGRFTTMLALGMPDHLHVVGGLRIRRLSDFVRTFKTATSRRANALLRTDGPFWHEGYFENTIRGDRQLEATLQYILENPIRDGLVASYDDYPFVVRSW